MNCGSLHEFQFGFNLFEKHAYKKASTGWCSLFCDIFGFKFLCVETSPIIYLGQTFFGACQSCYYRMTIFQMNIRIIIYDLVNFLPKFIFGKRTIFRQNRIGKWYGYLQNPNRLLVGFIS